MLKTRRTSPPIEVAAGTRRPLGMSPARFLRDYWQKRPLLVRGAFPDFTPPLSPDDLAGLACMDGALARIVAHAARRDHWTLQTGPFDTAMFARLPDHHWTLLVQDVDKWDVDTAALLEPFAFIPSWRIDDVMASYATDKGGVGAHVDQYDVFLLQGLGRRHWAIDTRPHPSTEFRDDVELKLLRHFHPTHTWTLEPGDMLYLPPGVPHDGVAAGECMTYSVGMRAPSAGELLFDLAAHLAETLPESRRLGDPDLAPVRAWGEIDAAALRRARRTLGPIATQLSDSALGDWFGGFITRYRSAQTAVPRKRRLTAASVAARLDGSLVERNPFSRFAWRRSGRDAKLYVAGAAYAAPQAWVRVLASPERVLDGARLLRLPQQARGLALLTALANAGHLSIRRH